LFLKVELLLFIRLVFSLTQDLKKIKVLFFLFFKTRYDWYQTESQVIITLMIKNVQKNDINVEFSEKEVVFEPYFMWRLSTIICKFRLQSKLAIYQVDATYSWGNMENTE
jgi:hypothetical protein